MLNETQKILNDLIQMAKRWRQDRERFLVKGGDNRLEVNEFEAELDEYFGVFLHRQMCLGFITKEQYSYTWGQIHDEWTYLFLKAQQMQKLSTFKWWWLYG